MADTIDLAYGRHGLALTLPDGVVPTIVQKRPLPVPSDAHAVIEAALAAPLASPTIDEAARSARSTCIVICDITRPVPNHLFLRPMIERICAAGVPLEGITVLIATGLHRPNLGDELAELIGDPWVLQHVRVANHDARDEASHRMLGVTPTRGTPVGIDRRFVDADLKIVTGLVEPHFMAGYSGGRKVIAPGIAHESTIRTFHSARFMEHASATSCVLDNNPLHEEQLAVVAMLDAPIFALNTVIDEERRLVYASYGDVLVSHMDAVAYMREAAEVHLPRRFRTVVTTSAGHPLDKTYYQTVKGMVTPLDILEPGGTLIIASHCAEGIGSPEFRASQARLLASTPEAFLESLLAKDQADIDEWQSEMQLKSQRVGDVALYSEGLSDDDHALTGVRRVTNLGASVAESVHRQGDVDVAVVPEGPYVVPFYSPA
jgi:nickel-dependent lactate racemase